MMINPYKERVIEPGMSVKVYRNLHTPNLFSIQCAKTGLVLAHGDRFYIKEVTPFVSQKGRERVLRQKKKYVHAYLGGIYMGDFIPLEDQVGKEHEVYYNPYKTEAFMNLNGDVVGFYEGKALNIKGELA